MIAAAAATLSFDVATPPLAAAFFAAAAPLATFAATRWPFAPPALLSADAALAMTAASNVRLIIAARSCIARPAADTVPGRGCGSACGRSRSPNTEKVAHRIRLAESVLSLSHNCVPQARSAMFATGASNRALAALAAAQALSPHTPPASSGSSAAARQPPVRKQQAMHGKTTYGGAGVTQKANLRSVPLPTSSKPSKPRTAREMDMDPVARELRDDLKFMAACLRELYAAHGLDATQMQRISGLVARLEGQQSALPFSGAPVSQSVPASSSPSATDRPC